MGWNFDMSQAPKGEWRKTSREIRGRVAEWEYYHAPRIIAAGNECVVTVSQWNHKRAAWSMFSADCPPLAWMPWPDHPEAMGASDA